MNKDNFHTSVMLEESIDSLNIIPEGNYVDCTLGEAGHSIGILRKLTTGKLSSFDRDDEAIEFVRNKYPEQLNEGKWDLIHDNFSKIETYFKPRSVDGVLMDIGMSSRQLDAIERGFSYKREDDPLDMRMDTRLGVKAADLLNALDESQLVKLFKSYGEEKFSRRIASEIKKSNKKIESVRDLTEVIDRAVPVTHSKTKTYRRIFQALRIVVNDELDSLEIALRGAMNVLRKDGRLVVITFHSLEDRIVKKFFKDAEAKGDAEILARAQEPTEQEVASNKRAHSAKLSVLMKT